MSTQQQSPQNLHKHKIYQKFHQQDSGFKAWQNDSILAQNNTNLLRNLKSQLLTYQSKYKKQDSNKTVPIKLPVLDYLKLNKNSIKNHNKIPSKQFQQPQDALTQRKQNTQSINKQNLPKHKSIQLYNKKQTGSKQLKRFTSQKTKPKLKQSYTLDQQIVRIQQKQKQKNQPILITKVQQMKFTQNQKRVRKRDLYLAIFGQRGKGKVQKLQFDDQNKGYQVYLQRKNHQMKYNNVEIGNQLLSIQQQNNQKLQKNKDRCTSQLNKRYNSKKTQGLGQSINIMLLKNSSHLPMRY